MKKFGILVFIAAIAVGVVVANIFSFGRIGSRVFNFSIGKSIHGSGTQASEKRDVSGFRGINVGNAFQVEVTAGQDYSVEVTADDNLLPLVQTYVSDGILKIETSDRIKSRNPLKITVSTPDLESLEASGATKVNIVNLKNNGLSLDVSGASKVTVSGETAKLIADVSGASNIDCGAMKATNAVVDASGASKVRVFATNRLESDASGASSITYLGNPTDIRKQASGASRISQE